MNDGLTATTAATATIALRQVTAAIMKSSMLKMENTDVFHKRACSVFFIATIHHGNLPLPVSDCSMG